MKKIILLAVVIMFILFIWWLYMNKIDVKTQQLEQDVREQTSDLPVKIWDGNDK